MKFGDHKIALSVVVASAVLLQLTACTEAQPGAEWSEGAIGSLQQPLLKPLQSAAPFEQIDMQGQTSFNYPYTPAQLRALGLPARRCDGQVTELGRTYSVSLEGSACTNTYFGAGHGDGAPYINSNPSFRYFYDPVANPTFHSGSSLQLTLPQRTQTTDVNGVPCTPGPSFPNCALPGPDRAEVSFYADGFEEGHGVGFGFENPKYFAFMMYIPAAANFSLVPGGAVHFMQAWQYYAGAFDGCGVPLVATLKNSVDPNQAVSPVQFNLEAIDQAGSYLSATSWPLRVNTWNRFVFFLDPNNNESGATGNLRVWLNDQLITDWHHDWGCNVVGTATHPATHTDKWHLRVGMYRPTLGPINQRLDVLFDDIRVAPSRRLATIY